MCNELNSICIETACIETTGHHTSLSGSFLRAISALKTSLWMFLGGGLARLRMLLTSALTKCLRSSLSWESSSDNFGSRYFARSKLQQTFSKPLRSSADNSLEVRFMTHLSFRDEPELAGDLLLSKWRNFLSCFSLCLVNVCRIGLPMSQFHTTFACVILSFTQWTFCFD